MHNSSCCGGSEKEKDMSCCREEKTNAGMVVDVVCGMKLDPKETKLQVEYKNEKYYFCNVDCKDMFERDPGKYMSINNQ